MGAKTMSGLETRSKLLENEMEQIAEGSAEVRFRQQEASLPQIDMAHSNHIDTGGCTNFRGRGKSSRMAEREMACTGEQMACPGLDNAQWKLESFYA